MLCDVIELRDRHMPVNDRIAHREMASTLSLVSFKHTPPPIYDDTYENKDMMDDSTFIGPIMSMNIDDTSDSYS